jgi:uncharacterized OB-fold protein
MSEVIDPSQRDPLAPSLVLAGDAVSSDAAGKPVLVGGRCRSCDAVQFPRRRVCSTCMSEDVVSEAMPRTGTLYSFTILHVGADHWNRPAGLGYVDLPNGVRIFSRIAGDLNALRIDQPVELAIAVIGEKDDTAIYNFVFRTAE